MKNIKHLIHSIIQQILLEQLLYARHCANKNSEDINMRWMKLEPIIQSEVSQKEKHRYSILTHIYGI